MGTRARWFGLSIGTVAIVVVAGGLASASIPSTDGVISGCYAKLGGGLRLVEDTAQCRSNELGITWNQQGASGDPGDPGEPGPAGPASNVTFDESGTFTIPAGVSTVVVEAWGGGGDAPSAGFGGFGGGQGAYVEAQFPVSAGAVLTVAVGSAGGGTSSVSVGSAAALVVAGGGQSGGAGGSGGGGVGSVVTPAVGLATTPGEDGGLPSGLFLCGGQGGVAGFAGSGGRCADLDGPAVAAVGGFVILHLA